MTCTRDRVRAGVVRITIMVLALIPALVLSAHDVKANGNYSWTGTPLNPVAGTNRYEFNLPECATALVSIP